MILPTASFFKQLLNGLYQSQAAYYVYAFIMPSLCRSKYFVWRGFGRSL